jgi:hypothetical protein
MSQSEGMDDMNPSTAEQSAADPRQSALEAAELALQPITALLLELGVSYQELGRLVRRSYVEEAASRQRTIGARPTISRIAAATGMSRQEVSQILAAPPRKAQHPDLSLRPADRVLAAWTGEPDFLFENGKPRPLPYSDANPSFSELVRKHGPDIPPRALLKELVASSLVSDLGDGTYLPGRPKSATRPPQGEAIQDFGAKLNALGLTLLRNLQARDTKPLFESMTITSNLPAGLSAKVARELDRRCRTFSQAIERFILDQTPESSRQDSRDARQEFGVMVAVVEKPTPTSASKKSQEESLDE